MGKLEALLGTSRLRLKLIAEKAGAYYRPFPKRDRLRPFQKQFKATKKPPRIIDNPEGELKNLQSKINTEILKPLAFPNYLCGGIPGKTVLDNVLIHLGAPVLVTLDIKSFFRRITNSQVYRVWRDLLKCSPKIAATLTRLTTFERHLPQGAPTSSLLANLVLFSVDEEIRAECARLGVTYSTWVDDLAFSGRDAQAVIDVAIQCLRRAGFSVSHRKLKRMGPGTRKLLNGVVLNRFPGVLKERLSRLRSGIHKLKNGEVSPQERETYVRRLQGGISYVSSIEPRKAAKLREELESVL